MSGTNHNPYPICIRCGKELNPQDSKGWELLAKYSDREDIWVCPNCIAEFQYIKHLPQSQQIINALFKIQSELKKISNEAKG